MANEFAPSGIAASASCIELTLLPQSASVAGVGSKIVTERGPARIRFLAVDSVNEYEAKM